MTDQAECDIRQLLGGPCSTSSSSTSTTVAPACGPPSSNLRWGGVRYARNLTPSRVRASFDFPIPFRHDRRLIQVLVGWPSTGSASTSGLDTNSRRANPLLAAAAGLLGYGNR